MAIRELFAKKIDREVEGVVKVESKEEAKVRNEIDEYIITKELYKHFIEFGNYFGRSFEEPVSDVGVWISGHFGSGKSHLLKMLAYLLANKDVDGESPLEMFREKFADDPASFMSIEKAVGKHTDTILFNIDATGMNKKDNTVILRVFAKKFYEYRGYCGEPLKVAFIEQAVEELGKTEEFRQAFEKHNGDSWLESRALALIYMDDTEAALQDIGMSEKAAKYLVENQNDVDEFTPEKLVSQIKAYVDTQPDDFRLVFMIDEVGQYVGTETSLLLNLQTMIELLGDNCKGKVWVVCTGQESVDTLIKLRYNEFSRILDRFKLRLSLSASTVDEVIKKRLLSKNDAAEKSLESLYDTEGATLKNLFAISENNYSIKGYSGPKDFIDCYPFASYQFDLLQLVYEGAHKAQNITMNTSRGARSMLTGFQYAATTLIDQPVGALAPFYLFYDNMAKSFDTPIRDVIQRCQKAADNDDGIENYDVSLLKLLLLLHYIPEQVPGNLEHLTVLMADNINVDKQELRAKIEKSLARLMSRNYISRMGDTYNFLTNEQQEIEREIKQIYPESSKISKKILEIIYGDIFTAKKHPYGTELFAFNQFVDGTSTGAIGADMTLRFVTTQTDDAEKSDEALRLRSDYDNAAIIVLSDTGYSGILEDILRIEIYTNGKNTNNYSETKRKLITEKNNDASKKKEAVKDLIERAIVEGTYYVKGERVPLTSGDAKNRIRQLLDSLTGHIYYKFDEITEHASSDADIHAVLTGDADDGKMEGFKENVTACSSMESQLEARFAKYAKVTAADVQDIFKKAPYGWNEYDIAALLARLIYEQKLNAKVNGEIIPPASDALPSKLHIKSEAGKVVIEKRIVVSETKKKTAIKFLREFFGVMNIRTDEDGLVADAIEKLTGLKNHYAGFQARYNGDKSRYPDYDKLEAAIAIIDGILSQKKDNTALITKLNDSSTALEDAKEDLASLEEFFDSQVAVYDSARTLYHDIQQDIFEFQAYDDAASKALGRISLILASKPFRYGDIKDLNPNMTTVRAAYSKMVEEKRADILEHVRACMERVHTAADGVADAGDIIRQADTRFTQEKDSITRLASVALLNSRVIPLDDYTETVCTKIEAMKSKPGGDQPAGGGDKPKSQNIKKVMKTVAFPNKTLTSEDQIDAYLKNIGNSLKALLKGCDGIDIK